MKLVLVGVRGSGKSTAGALLARRLALSFLDLDDAITRRAGRPVAEILTGAGGEPELRRLESAALRELEPDPDGVLAPGGGAVLEAANRELLRRLGPVVWLTVSPQEAARRTAVSPRPPLTDLAPPDEVRQLAERRAPMYRDLATATVETDGKSVEEVCNELEQLWNVLSRQHLR